jgi:DNA-binding Lrp family transcriptional regulator
VVKITQGFVLIKAASNYEHKVYNKITELPEIKKIHPVSGEYDLIVQLDSDDFEKTKIIAEKIGSIEGVLRTKIVTEPKY